MFMQRQSYTFYLEKVFCKSWWEELRECSPLVCNCGNQNLLNTHQPMSFVFFPRIQGKSFMPRQKLTGCQLHFWKFFLWLTLKIQIQTLAFIYIFYRSRKSKSFVPSLNDHLPIFWKHISGDLHKSLWKEDRKEIISSAQYF